jgi:hypothetical protein
MNYSLFIKMVKEMVSMEPKGKPGVTPAAYPSYPCILQICIVYSLFLHFPSRKSWKRTHVGEDGPHHMDQESGCMVNLFSPSRCSSLTSSSHDLSFLEKMTWKKIGSI